MKSKTETVELTAIELGAAFLACSNYTPGAGKGWKQAAQTRACNKLRVALQRVKRRKNSARRRVVRRIGRREAT